LLPGGAFVNYLHFLFVQGFVEEQHVGQLPEKIDFPRQYFPGMVITLADQLLDPAVDEPGRLLAVHAARHLFTQEPALLPGIGKRPDFTVHAPPAHHPGGDLHGLLEIILGPGGLLSEGHLLRGPAAEQNRNPAQQVFPGVGVTILHGQLLGVPQGPAPGDDRNLVQGVGLGKEPGQNGMTGLVIRHGPPVLFVDHHPFPLNSHEDAVLGDLKVRALYILLVGPAGDDGGLVHQAGQFGAGKPGGAAGYVFQVDILAQGHPAGVDLEDLQPPLHIRGQNVDLPVEAPGPEQGRVKDVGTVGGGEDDDGLIGGETVHFHQEGVQGLTPFILSAGTAAGRAVAADGVDLVDEDDAGGVLLGFPEQVADPGCTDPDEHLDEIGAAHAVKRHTRFPGNRLGQQGLARARRALEENAAGNDRPQLAVLFGLLEKVDDLDQFFLGLGHPGHVPEGNGGRGRRETEFLFLVDLLGLILPDLPAGQEVPGRHDQEHGNDHPQEVPDRRGLFAFPPDNDVFFQEPGNQGGDIRGIGGELPAEVVHHHDIAAFEAHGGNLVVFQADQELVEADGRPFVFHLPEEDDDAGKNSDQDKDIQSSNERDHDYPDK